MTRSQPKVVAFDTDGTIWSGTLNPSTWGKGRGASRVIQDNIEPGDSDDTVRDKTNHSKHIELYTDVKDVLDHIVGNYIGLAILPPPGDDRLAMTDKALKYFKITNPNDGTQQSFFDLANTQVGGDDWKLDSLRKIKVMSGYDYSDMIVFSDEASHNAVRIELGATFQLVGANRPGNDSTPGLTADDYKKGIKAWYNATMATVLSLKQPAIIRRREVIGYSGLPPSWVNLVNKGEGTVDRTLAYRWGYGLYVTDNVLIAEFFGSLLPAPSYVCAVIVKDYDAWLALNKMWIPEHHSYLPFMDNRNWTAEETAQNQESRDYFIDLEWKCPTPYVLFSKHHSMWGMPVPYDQRFTEMVIYTQIQRSLIELQIINFNPIIPTVVPFDVRIQEWRINVPPETKLEFMRNGEVVPLIA